MLRRTTVFLLVMSAFWSRTIDIALAQSPRLPLTSDILNDIQLIKSERGTIDEVLASEQLKEDLDALWKHDAMETIDDSVIDQLISLLDDDDDGVRQIAAGGIGGFGVRAERAEPALNRALERIKGERSQSRVPFIEGGDSLSAILFALDRIHGVPVALDRIHGVPDREK